MAVCGQSVSRFNANRTYHDTNYLFSLVRPFLLNAIITLTIQRKVVVHLAVPFLARIVDAQTSTYSRMEKNLVVLGT